VTDQVEERERGASGKKGDSGSSQHGRGKFFVSNAERFTKELEGVGKNRYISPKGGSLWNLDGDAHLEGQKDET